MLVGNQSNFTQTVLYLQEDQEELEHIIRTELTKYERERQSVQNCITKQVTEVENQFSCLLLLN